MARRSASRGDHSARAHRPPADPGQVFRPVVGSLAADEVIDQITHAIRAGHYRIGEKLPSVPELAVALDVSRPVISDAVGELAEHGVVDIRRGARGGFVVRTTRIPVKILRRSAPLRARTLRELLEARRPVETELARLAALRATRDDLDELARINEEMIAASGEGVAWSTENTAFHYVFGRAARSPALAYLQHDVLEQITVILDDGARYSDREKAIRSHLATLEAIASGDPDAAAEAMDEHLRELEEAADWLDRYTPTTPTTPSAIERA